MMDADFADFDSTRVRKNASTEMNPFKMTPDRGTTKLATKYMQTELQMSTQSSVNTESLLEPASIPSPTIRQNSNPYSHQPNYFSSQSNSNDLLNHMNGYFDRIISMMTRMDQRLNALENTTRELVRIQKESPPASAIEFAVGKAELTNVKRMQEQMEKDMEYAKKLQANFDYELSGKKGSVSTPSFTPNITNNCPICGKTFSRAEIEDHSIACLEANFGNVEAYNGKDEIKKPQERQSLLMRIFGVKKAEAPSKSDVVLKTEEQTPPPIVPELVNSNGMVPAYPPQMYPMMYPYPPPMPYYDPSMAQNMGNMPMYMPYAPKKN